MPILLAKVSTPYDVPESPLRWKAGLIVDAFPDNHEFGGREVPEAGRFYHVAITDKTLEQVQEYLQSWKHDPLIVQVSRQGQVRLIEVSSTMVSATGKNAFERAAVDELLLDINGTYQSHTQNSFRFTITVSTTEESDAHMATIKEAVKDMQYARRRWYITQSGMTYLANNGGTVSGTAAQVAGYIRDGLLD